MRSVRVHLRHTGSSKLRFGVTRLARCWCDHESWGYNLTFGRWWVAIRDRNLDPEHYKPKRFFDLSFGRSQLKNRRLWDSMTEEEIDLYSNNNAQHYRLDYFLKLIRNGESRK